MDCLRATRQAEAQNIPSIPVQRAPVLLLGMHPIKLIELGRCRQEHQVDVADRARTVLGHDNTRDALVGSVVARGLSLVGGTVQEHDDIGVLLDGARFAQVGKLRALAGTGFDLTRQLRQRDQWDLEFLGHNL